MRMTNKVIETLREMAVEHWIGQENNNSERARLNIQFINAKIAGKKTGAKNPSKQFTGC
jgi:hypothetical protein